MKTLKLLLLCTFFVVACKKDDPPVPPGRVTLISPAKNSECSPIEDSESEGTNLVKFSWQESTNTNSYLLFVKNLNTGLSQTKTTMSLSEIITINKGVPYSWSVTSKNNAVNEIAVSETWFFFSPGGETSYAPFPAELIGPAGPKALIDGNGEVTLEWAGSDLDNDIDGFELYFSTQNPPALLSSLDAGETSAKVAAITNTVYYWKVVTKDKEGNTSDTGVISFEAI